MSDTTVCVSDGCVSRGRHKPGAHKPCECVCHETGGNPLHMDGSAWECLGMHPAPEEECQGCLPRQAADGLMVCRKHADLCREWLKELPDLYDALLTPSRRGGSSDYIKGNPDRAPLALADAPRMERSAIRACFVSWMFVLIEERSMTAPRDDIAAMADRLDIHLMWLLSGEHADQLVSDLKNAVHGARRRAYPARPDTHPLGRCPLVLEQGEVCNHLIRAKASDAYITCPKCGTEAVIDWWQSVIHADGEVAPLLTAAEAAAHLSWTFKRVITEEVVRMWASRPLKPKRGQSRSDTADIPPLVERRGKDAKGRTLYDRADLLRHADYLYKARAA